MAICLRVFGSGEKPIQIGHHLVDLPLTACDAGPEFVRVLDCVKVLLEPSVIRPKMSPRVRARLEINGEALRGRQRHEISDPVDVESVGQKLNHDVTCKTSRQHMMDRKHATVTFWRTPVSELIVSSAGSLIKNDL
ncbi:hypothetical protein SAMN05216330_10977 [Bradyrhizobium sp. Ghvi]|nr:hypothetical protein SAMN05216330_10977 [Bradyrhizobium sp. Ghvi]